MKHPHTFLTAAALCLTGSLACLFGAATAPIPESVSQNYAVLPFIKFAPDVPAALNDDGSPNVIWYQGEVCYLETTDAPPEGSPITSVPSIPADMFDAKTMHHFTPLLGARYAFTDFLWIDRTPLGKLLKEPIPFGTIFYFVAEREKRGLLDIQVYLYHTNNLRWVDAGHLKLDKDGDVEHDGTFLPRPALHQLAERVSVKLGNWTLFLISKRIEPGVASGGLRTDKTYYGYLALRLRPSIVMRQAPQEVSAP